MKYEPYDSECVLYMPEQHAETIIDRKKYKINIF